MDLGFLVVCGLVAPVVCCALYCLFTGLNPFRPRRWTDRALQMVAGMVGLFLVFLLFFGDS
jgi:hypothetical protein